MEKAFSKTSKDEKSRPKRQFVYTYCRYDDRYHEYYLARSEEEVYRYVFTFMTMERVQLYFTEKTKKEEKRNRHNQYTLEEAKEYLQHAGGGTVRPYRKPDFIDVARAIREAARDRRNGYI